MFLLLFCSLFLLRIVIKTMPKSAGTNVKQKNYRDQCQNLVKLQRPVTYLNLENMPPHCF